MEDSKLMPDSFYEERRVTIRWRQSTLPRAGIWLAEGRYQVVMHGGSAEARLREQGALFIASVAFDNDHGERPVKGDVTVDVIPADDLPHHGRHRAVESLGWAPASN
jgi:hypothetical protein